MIRASTFRTVSCLLSLLAMFAPAFADTITATRNGSWSDAATWDRGTVPTAADAAVIPPGLSVDVIEPAECRTLDVAGSLYGHRLITTYGNVRNLPGGYFFLDDYLQIVVADDRLMVGGDLAEDKRANDVGVWNEGSFVIRGTEKTPYVDLLPVEAFADWQFGIQRARCGTLAKEPVCWLDSDRYFIVTPDGLTMSTTKAGIGDNAAYALKIGDRVILPRVVNLSRTAGIHGGKDGHRPHLIVLHDGELDAQFAEFVDMGPAGKLGRYPVHLHHAEHGSTVDGCVVLNSGNRAFAIHDSGDHRLTRNIVFWCAGHAFFMEDPKGAEAGNEIRDNTSILVSFDGSGFEVVPTPEKDIYNRTAHYWLRPGNLISDNLAVGGNALGCVVMNGKGGTSATITNHHAWGCGTWGLQNVVPVKWENPVAIKCGVAGYASTAFWVGGPDGKRISDEGTRLVGPVLALNGERPAKGQESYASQIFLNQSPDTATSGGGLVGKVCTAIHYTSALKVEGAIVNCDTLASMTYWESPVTFSGCDIRAKYLTDLPYAPRIPSHGLLRLTTTLNGFGVDKSFASDSVATMAGLPSLGAIQDAYKRNVAKEVPNVPALGRMTIPAGVKYLRMWQPGTAKPTTWPMGVTPFAGLVPGRYLVEGYAVDALRDANGAVIGPAPVLGSWEVTIRPNETTKVE